MKKAFQVILISMFSVSSHSISLEGTWQEDKDKTTTWNLTNTKVDPEKLEKLASLMGYMYIKYDSGTACQFFEPYTLEHKNRIKDIPRFSTETLAAIHCFSWHNIQRISK